MPGAPLVAQPNGSQAAVRPTQRTRLAPAATRWWGGLGGKNDVHITKKPVGLVIQEPALWDFGGSKLVSCPNGSPPTHAMCKERSDAANGAPGLTRNKDGG